MRLKQSEGCIFDASGRDYCFVRGAVSLSQRDLRLLAVSPLLRDDVYASEKVGDCIPRDVRSLNICDALSKGELVKRPW